MVFGIVSTTGAYPELLTNHIAPLFVRVLVPLLCHSCTWYGTSVLTRFQTISEKTTPKIIPRINMATPRPAIEPENIQTESNVYRERSPITQQKITDVQWLRNISDVCLLSDVSDNECSCALFVHWNICAQIINRTFVHKRLTNISDVRLLSVCAQTVDRYIGMKRKRKLNENQENNTLGECKQLSQEKSQTLVRYVGQQTDSKRLSDVLVHKRLHGQIYIRLLSEHRTSVCCPFAVQNFLLCTMGLVFSV